MYSVLIRGGQIVDGTGKSSYRADVALSGDQIVAVAERIDELAEQVIDAGGLVVAPGFIDIHSHTDQTIFSSPLAESKLMQGVTSEVIGNCGIGLFPAVKKHVRELEDYAKVHAFVLGPGGIKWENFPDYACELTKLSLGPNLLPLVAHGALRIAAMGFNNRRPSDEELAIMKRLLASALQAGAWGLSTGLIYPPSSFADTKELISLARVLAGYGALYTTHVRGESGTLLSAIEEAIAIGRASGARVQVSHLKALGQPNWGKGKEALARILAAKEEGVDIGADQYPYEASSTSLTALVPEWAHAGGVEQLLARLDDPSLRERLKTEINQQICVRGGPERVMIAHLSCKEQAGLSGRTLAEIAAKWQLEPVDAVFKLLKDNHGTVGAVYFSISRDDVASIVACPEVAVGSDGYGLNAEKDNILFTHPRSYGTFPRVLARFVREKGLLSLETAIYKMTGLPAKRLGLLDRGLIKPGLAADITIFDPSAVADKSDFMNPHQYANGIIHVFVNGQAVVRDGRLTGKSGGRVLRKTISHQHVWQ